MTVKSVNKAGPSVRAFTRSQRIKRLRDEGLLEKKMLKKIAQEERQKRLWKCHQYEFHERSQENLPKKLKKIAKKAGKVAEKDCPKKRGKVAENDCSKNGKRLPKKDRRKKIAEKRSPKKIAKKAGKVAEKDCPKKRGKVAENDCSKNGKRSPKKIAEKRSPKKIAEKRSPKKIAEKD